MNRLIVSILVLLVWGMPGHPVRAQEVHELSLAQAIDYALTHNQNLENAGLQVAAAEGFVKENIATGFPQINGSVDLSDNFNLPITYLPAEIVGGPPGEYVPVQFGTRYSGNANLNVTQMVFDGVFFVGLEAARTFKERTEKEYKQAKISLREAVTKAYYNVLVNELTLELIEKNYGRLDTLLSETRAMYENGFAERIDVSRVQVQYNNIKVSLDNARKSLQVARALLKFQLGMPVSDSLVLTDRLDATMFEPVEEEDFTYNRRIEYSILQTQEKLALLNIKRTKVEYLPKLDLYLNLGAVAGTGLAGNLFNIGNEWFDFGVAGLKLTVPVFDGLRKHYNIQQRKIELEQVHNNFDYIENQINLEIQQARVAYENGVANMKTQLENMKIAEEVYQITKTKYQQGVGSNIEVINADAEYKEAQTNYFQALYQALIAKVEYEKALGLLN